MLGYFPLASFPNVNIGIASLNLGAIIAHCELVDTCILSPVAASSYIS